MDTKVTYGRPGLVVVLMDGDSGWCPPALHGDDLELAYSTFLEFERRGRSVRAMRLLDNEGNEWRWRR